ncbi:MAG: trypsin-like peptidase domain-containing protein [Burkholderiaceae bacterium]|jgi:Do/DeqQ family serine protease|nr:trypsin-like peptidase domain-containing protein [Burkholderiaceae bacterium]
MKRLWLVFAQTVTVLLAAYFVVLTFKPAWLERGAVLSVPPAALAPVAPLAPPASAVSANVPAAPGQVHPGSFSAAVSKAAPAVVSIDTSTAPRRPAINDPWFQFFFGDDSGAAQSGLGSGVIVRADGYVLTNNHVVENADQIEVALTDGRRAQAKMIGTDPDSDLAVLKIDLPNLPVITLGDSSQLRVGDRALAIGNPFGVGQTVTSGIISALGRNQLGLNAFENFIQTDAAINPGNSGGALIDASGNLIGINTAIYSRSGGSMGIGFAIPVAAARQVMDSIIAHGKVVRGWVGVESAELTPELAQTFNLPQGMNQGVLVTGVLAQAPAAQAGIRPGDVIVQVAGQRVRSVPELLSRIAALPPGQSVRFQVQRQNRALALDVTPAQRPRPRDAGR